MAYTSVIPVRRLDRAVKYVMNKEKTTAVSLQDALDYAANRDKTEQSCFESSYACTLETAFSDMRQTKEHWHKSGGVQGYHLVQSFAAGEVSPELAHQIAKELADRVLGGRYEYVIGTHLNTGHIHSHIVWNSVSCVDGKKYRSNYKSYVTEIRAVSDELCRKYKLSVIDTENSNHVAKPYAEWLAEKNGQPTWRTAIRQDVDEAIQQSLTWRQFLNALERKGYEVRMGRKYPVLRPPGKERFVRFKTLGKRYTPEAIQTRILYPRSYRPYVENPPTIKHGRLRSGKKPCRKLTGLRALYYRYLYELGALPRKPRRPSYAVRQDAYKLDQRIRQMEFLSKHDIDTLAQLETHRQALQTEIGQLLTKRKQLPKTNDVQSQRESVNTALKQLRQEERLCRKIAEHSIEVQQHLTEARRDRFFFLDGHIITEKHYVDITIQTILCHICCKTSRNRDHCHIQIFFYFYCSIQCRREIFCLTLFCFLIQQFIYLLYCLFKAIFIIAFCCHKEIIGCYFFKSFRIQSQVSCDLPVQIGSHTYKSFCNTWQIFHILGYDHQCYRIIIGIFSDFKLYHICFLPSYYCRLHHNTCR